MTDPTTDDFGAGAGPNFKGHLNARRNFRETAGVVEAIPGLIESTNIDPLNENSNKGAFPTSRACQDVGCSLAVVSSADDGWANATVAPGTGSGSSGTGIGSFASGAANTATAIAASAAGVSVGAAQMAYGHAMGDEATKQAGKEAVWGKQ